nr:hypothetical protein CFP56_31006 [Quercus suber]
MFALLSRGDVVQHQAAFVGGGLFIATTWLLGLAPQSKLKLVNDLEQSAVERSPSLYSLALLSRNVSIASDDCALTTQCAAKGIA